MEQEGKDTNGGKDGAMSWLAVVGWILAFALFFVLATLIHGLGSLSWQDWRELAALSGRPVRNWSPLLNIFLFFATLGAYYGSIAMLDGRSDMATRDRPVLRTSLCGALAAIITVFLESSTASIEPIVIAIGTAIGALLGYLGWRWAKHVDF